MLGILKTPSRAAAVVSDTDLWAEVRRMAEIHRFSGLLADAAAPWLPSSCQEWRNACLMSHFRRHSVLVSALSRVADACAEAGIPCVSLKGPLLAERYYPKPFLRTCVDIDLLIPAQHTGTAARLMAKLGYRLEELYPWRFQRRIAPHLTFFSSDGSPVVEIHYFLTGGAAPIPSEEFVERSISWRSPNGPACRILAPADEAFFSCVHAAGHAFHRLRWLYDTILIARSLTPEARQSAWQLALRYKTTGPYSAADVAAREFFGETMALSPEGQRAHLDPRDVRRMVERVEGRPVKFSQSAGYYVDLCRIAGSPAQAGQLLGYAADIFIRKRYYSLRQREHILSSTLPA